jgi:tetratricopeptide (TPR) repeat protein/tRNA A-37 threonylcarbamoyl transferase component Bud32
MPEDLTYTAGSGETAAELTVTPLSPPGYELIDEIGQGGMGVVYRARDVALDRDVAVKLLSPRYPADSLPAQRFLSEARITGQLQHPGIPAVHQVGALADGRPFLAMKLIKGSTLEALLKHRPESAAERGRLLAIFEAVCQAVGYAHAHRVIHRDLKPANIMVGAFGEVQVMDWGLAKVLGEETPATADALVAEQTRAWTQIGSTPEAGSHTQAGSLVGTPAFIPPEQALGEIEKVNERSDVFGLGALLAVILTGKPPYVGENYESVRVQAVRGKLEDCFARLDGCGAEPELVALCKKCLAFEPADRPADAVAMAAAVAGLRAAADERARRAELDKVRVEGEKAASEARALERRKRRQLAMAASAVLAVAVIGGLTAVLAVQQRANDRLDAKNHELIDEQAKVQAKNAELADEQAKVQERFELAQKAIALFHTGVSEDMLLKNAAFEGLRTKLLKEAAGFYADLEKLLAGQTDAKSHKALAVAYFQLGELTDKIGDKKEALAVHRKGLALRRELAAAGADVETRLDVTRSLRAVGVLLHVTGDMAGALSAFEEQRDLAAALESEAPTDAVRTQRAYGHNGIGNVHSRTGKPAEALKEYQQALAIWQKLADAKRAVTEFQTGLAASYKNIGNVLTDMGKRAEALKEYQQALTIWQKLVDANRAVTEFQIGLAAIHFSLGILQRDTGDPAEPLKEFQQALAIWQRLAEANPAVTEFQSNLNACYGHIGVVLSQTGKSAEALMAWQKAGDILQKLADANPDVTEFKRRMAWGHNYYGRMLSNMGKSAEALKEYQQALTIWQKLVDANPGVPQFQTGLAWGHNEPGRLHAREKRFTEAFAALDQGLAICQKLAESHPTITPFTNDLALSHAYRGWAHVRADHPAEAAADLRRALALWEKAKPSWRGHRFERGRALGLLAGLAADGKSGVSSAEAAAFADQAVAVLRDAISDGWNVPDELKEPDFDAVRGRDDFKKLLAELKAKSIGCTLPNRPRGRRERRTLIRRRGRGVSVAWQALATTTAGHRGLHRQRRHHGAPVPIRLPHPTGGAPANPARPLQPGGAHRLRRGLLALDGRQAGCRAVGGEVPGDGGRVMAPA